MIGGMVRYQEGVSKSFLLFLNTNRNNPPAKKTAWLSIILFIHEAMHLPIYIEKSDSLMSKISENAFTEINPKRPAIAITINTLSARFIFVYFNDNLNPTGY